MKKAGIIFFTLILITTGLSSLFAGGQKDDSSESKKPITITVGASQNWIKDVDREIAKDFEAETGIKVDFQVNPDDQYSQIVKVKLLAGEAPDLFYWPSGMQLTELPNNKLADLTQESWTKNYTSDLYLKSTSIEDKVVALNIWGADGWGIIYNSDIFDKYGLNVPENYNELKEVCEVLKKEGIIPMYEWPSEIWHSSIYLQHAVCVAEQREPGVYDKLNNNKISYADVPEFLLAMEQMKEFAELGYFGENYMSDTWAAAVPVMAEEKAAMIIAYTAFPNEVYAVNPEMDADTLKMFPMPFGSTTGKVDVFATSSGGIVQLIPSEGSNIDAVKEFLNYKTRVDVLDKFYAARNDLAVSSHKGVSTVKVLETVRTITESVNGNFQMDAAAGVWAFDMMGNGTEVQAVLAGAITPEEAVMNLDSVRMKLGKTAGKAGF